MFPNATKHLYKEIGFANIVIFSFSKAITWDYVREIPLPPQNSNAKPGKPIDLEGPSHHGLPTAPHQLYG